VDTSVSRYSFRGVRSIHLLSVVLLSICGFFAIKDFMPVRRAHQRKARCLRTFAAVCVLAPPFDQFTQLLAPGHSHAA
jgi:hypothetical protein